MARWPGVLAGCSRIPRACWARRCWSGCSARSRPDHRASPATAAPAPCRGGAAHRDRADPRESGAVHPGLRGARRPACATTLPASVLHPRQPALAADAGQPARPTWSTMPGDVLKAVITFYTLDAEINQFLDTLMQPAFLDRPVEQRIEILEVYADLFDAAVARARDAEAELAAARLGQLALVVGGPPALPPRHGERARPEARPDADRRLDGAGHDLSPGTTAVIWARHHLRKAALAAARFGRVATLHQLVAFAARASRRCTTAAARSTRSSSRNSSLQQRRPWPCRRRGAPPRPRRRSAHRIVAVEQAVAADPGRPRGHQMIDEDRAGVGRDEPVGQLQVDRMLRLQREPVERRPRLALADLQLEVVAGAGQAERLERGRLVDRRHPNAKGAVGVAPPKPTSARNDPSGSSTRNSMWVRGVTAPSGRRQTHAAASARDLEAEGAQHVQEQRVVLEAVAAPAPAGRACAAAIAAIEPDRPAEQHVQILERDPAGMVGLEGRQRGQRGLGRAAIADAAEIGVEVDASDRPC